jgi:hypothetical protein
MKASSIIFVPTEGRVGWSLSGPLSFGRDYPFMYSLEQW